jgi:hypothetical protein
VFQAQEIAAHLSDVADLVDDGVGHGADGVVGGLAALRAHSVVNEGVASLLVRVLKQSVRPSEEEPDLVQGVGLDWHTGHCSEPLEDRLEVLLRDAILLGGGGGGGGGGESREERQAKGTREVEYLT